VKSVKGLQPFHRAIQSERCQPYQRGSAISPSAGSRLDLRTQCGVPAPTARGRRISAIFSASSGPSFFGCLRGRQIEILLWLLSPLWIVGKQV